MTTTVLKIKCLCRPTPQGVPRPPANLMWLKRAAHDNHGLSSSFTVDVRSGVSEVSTGAAWSLDRSPFERGDIARVYECGKCHRQHTLSESQLRQWWEQYRAHELTTVEL